MNYLVKQARKAFVDSLRIKVQGGSGGHGLAQYGGIGGKGGDVYVVASSKVTRLDRSLKNPAYKAGWFKAGNGEPALRSRLLGEPGSDLEIKVPLGVSITDIDGQHIGDVNEDEAKVIVASGGRGGDKLNDNHGFIGQKRSIKLDFKMISDAVFVGFPNAGKSSLLRAISEAKPRVASYPFTTLRPHLGVAEFQDFRRITMTDLPGLVEGAHKNLGLGHEFLKHIERSRVLIFIVDINPVDLGPSYSKRTTLETLCILNREIELYDDTLLKKPAILAISKVDSFTEGDYLRRYEKFREELEALHGSEGSALQTLDKSMMPENLLKFDEILPISAQNNLNIGKLKKATRLVIDKYEEAAKSEKDNFTTFKDLQRSEFNRIAAD